MEFVQPIRDRRQIEAMKRVLRGSNLRDWLLFVLGINSGLRVSDLLSLKVADVWESGKVKDRISLRERKTGKMKDFPLSPNAKKAIQEYLASRDIGSEDEPLFMSRKGGALQRQQAWRILNRAARMVGIKERIGTHTLRKTFGYHAYRQGQDIVLLQKLFNHSSPAITLRYIGIQQDEIDDVYLTVNL
ncbi:site-specific integrase [Alicyclobacillus macrosporangiidus]|uniref:Phage integrase family protein n=1 Tax=Alicyclobacillus macrosporangiidus TaxID=392015 RepID=A0A1I7L214_9BACL|nr:site-specific integrase [Alicyclobacillus macrosporangiidus]SFV03812.1 Phage integrase family protein [Alicyclobacillus macrosporangiidus]